MQIIKEKIFLFLFSLLIPLNLNIFALIFHQNLYASDSMMKTILLEKIDEKYNNKDFKGVIKDYDKYIELDPKNPKAFGNRAFIKMKLEDYKGAIKDYGKAIKLSPNRMLDDNKYWEGRSLAKFYLDDYRGGLNDIDKALKMQPYDNRAKYIKGMILYAKGKKKRGCIQIRESFEVMEKSPWTYEYGVRKQTYDDVIRFLIYKCKEI